MNCAWHLNVSWAKTAVRETSMGRLTAARATGLRSARWSTGPAGSPSWCTCPARSTNENTNGLLRQYFPKGSDLRVHGPEALAAVAAELNDRPRKALGWTTPAARLAAALRHGSDS
jgi:hypothetical protein